MRLRSRAPRGRSTRWWSRPASSSSSKATYPSPVCPATRNCDGFARRSTRRASRTTKCRSSAHAALTAGRTPPRVARTQHACLRAARCPVPDPPDGHGLGGDPRAGGGGLQRRRHRLPGRRHDSTRGGRGGDPAREGAHGPALRRELPDGRAGRRRDQRRDHPPGREGRGLQPRAQRGADRRSSRTPAWSAFRPAAPKHAAKAEKLGADIIIVQGGEGGGHTGNTPTSLLVSACADTVSVPVVAAGGFRDGRGLVAALAFGAEGIAMGTRFLLTRESPVPDVTTDRYPGRRASTT